MCSTLPGHSEHVSRIPSIGKRSSLRTGGLGETGPPHETVLLPARLTEKADNPPVPPGSVSPHYNKPEFDGVVLMRTHHIESNMSNASDRSTERSFVAEEPHCGVCEHVYFAGDWDQTPHCAEFEQTTTIRVGDVCSSFTLRKDLDDTRLETDVDVDIDWSEQVTGKKAPFYPALRDGERYSWLCGHCRSLDVAVGPMDDFECTECGNTHAPTEWDAAYM